MMRPLMILICIAFMGKILAQQPGDLDTSFAVGGKLILEQYGPVRDVVVQADGKIVVLTSGPFFNSEMEHYSEPPLPHYLLRFNDDGTLDPSFGVDASVEFDWMVRRLLLRADEKFIAAGNLITRLMPDGSTDASFADDGILELFWNDNAIQWNFAVLFLNEDIAVAGGAANAGILGRVTSDGYLDTSFGSGNSGYLVYTAVSGNYGSTIRTIQGLAVDQTGHIFLHQRRQTGGLFPTATIFLKTLAPNGMELNSVSLREISHSNFNNTTIHSKGLALNSNGCLFSYISGYSNLGVTPASFHLAGECEETTTGLTNPFAPYGPPESQPWPVDFPGGTNAFILEDGGFMLPQRLQVTPFFQTPSIVGFATIKFKPNSLELDSAWGFQGFLWTEILGSADEGARSFAQQADGKFLVGGHARTETTWKFVLVRYLNEYGPACKLDLKMKLGGARVTDAELMRDDLRAQGLLPLEQPYAPPAYSPVDGVGDDSFDPGLLQLDGDSAIVDWVWLELLDPADPDQVLATRVGLLQRNGRVTQADGSKPIDFEIGSGSYLLRVKHRNHLSVTLQPVQLGMFPPHVDVTDPATPTFGTDAQKEVDGKMMLWPGDVNGNGNVKYVGPGNDRDPILISIGGSTPTATANGYLLEDVNMDGVVKYVGTANDRDIILQTIGGTVPTAVRMEQGP